jgi:hypothetical protein
VPNTSFLSSPVSGFCVSLYTSTPSRISFHRMHEILLVSTSSARLSGVSKSGSLDHPGTSNGCKWHKLAQELLGSGRHVEARHEAGERDGEEDRGGGGSAVG